MQTTAKLMSGREYFAAHECASMEVEFQIQNVAVNYFCNDLFEVFARVQILDDFGHYSQEQFFYCGSDQEKCAEIQAHVFDEQGLKTAALVTKRIIHDKSKQMF